MTEIAAHYLDEARRQIRGLLLRLIYSCHYN